MKKILSYLFLCALLCALNGCGVQSGDVRNSVNFFAMDTLMEFSAYADETTLSGAREIVTELESRVSTTNAKSEIYRLNHDGGGTVSPGTAELLRTALSMCRLTNGAFDLSIYPVVRAWGFTTGEYRIPSGDELAALLAQVDYTRIRLDGEDVSLPDGMEIDLGGIAKGYAGRKAAEYLREHGVTSALLNLGGNVQTVGEKPDGTPWRVAVQDPLQSGAYAGILEIRNQAAVTSGGYERHFTGEDGETYWHIMDPETGRPARSGLLSVTVVADDGALCDALSTALFVMGAETAERFWREHQDFEMVLITEDGEAIVTPGLSYTPEAYPVRTLTR